MRPVKPHYREGYKTLNSEEGICISRVAAILTMNVKQGNVAYCRGFKTHTA